MSTREATELMATWIAAIADNVKNPIAGIAAVLNLAEARADDPQAVLVALRQIRARLDHLDEYVTELAGFARPVELRSAWTDVGSMIADATAHAALPSVCSVETATPSGFEAYVDGAKLTRALSALIRNAFEAVGSDTAPRVRVTTSGTADGMAITVEDNGPGLSAAAAARAVEPFFTSKEAGTGLGLTLAGKYAEAHGGRLVIDRSADLGGCRVSIRIPDLRRNSRSAP
jgi:signal transduction histidine kinase